MRVNRQSGCTRNSFYHGQTHRNVGDKPPIHHVHVQQGSAGLLDSLNLFTQTSEISRENGWSYLDHRNLRAKVLAPSPGGGSRSRTDGSHSARVRSSLS